MALELSGQQLQKRFEYFVLIVFLLQGVLSFLLIDLGFGLTSQQSVYFTKLFVGLTILLAGLVYYLAGSLIRPISAFVEAHDKNIKVPNELIEGAFSAAKRLFRRFAIIGLVVPIAWMMLVSALLKWFVPDQPVQFGLFGILGFFNSIVLMTAMYISPQNWLRHAFEMLSSYRGLELRGFSIRTKTVFITTVLACVPTCLVGLMAYSATTQLVVKQTEQNLQRILKELEKPVVLIDEIHTQEPDALLRKHLNKDQLTKETEGLLGLFITIALVCMLVASVVGFAFANNLSRKVGRMVRFASDLAQGGLKDEVRVFSDDELGDLGANLHSLSENLRRMVRGMTAVANRISDTCSQLLVRASAITTGAEIQSQSVAETSRSVETLNSNVQSASESLLSLATASHETVEAAHKISESFGLMQVESNGLQSIIEQTGLLVSKMYESTAIVGRSVEELNEGARRSALSMKDVDRSISAVSSSAADTARLARQAIDVAQEGEIAVSRTVEGMDRIVGSTKKASEVILGLSNRVEAISSILGVIEEIADQTNLLALNAAIIAAQAGEHGRSFAVVADEIRSLAERTSASTREIAQMINDIQDTSNEASTVMRGGVGIVNNGVALAQQAGDSLSLILSSVQKAAANVEEIANITEAQAKASEMVTRDMGHVADMASRITEHTSNQATASEQLQRSFHETLATSQAMSNQIDQQSMENRQAMASVASMKESAARANEAMLSQSSVSAGIVEKVEQVREIAKNHAMAASEMSESTQALAKKSVRLKEEIDHFQI